MENNSIREFTCNDCQEVTKVDWSKVRPDIDDGTSNIEIHEKGNGYAYYGECMNCGNLVEIEPPVPELIVDNVDVDKDGMYIQLTDTVTNRSCWIEAWQDKNGDWEYDFNQYIFHLDNENDIVAKMFQEDLGNYAEDVFDCVMGAINEHEEEYNKLQENKAPTMRDRLKEAKAGTVSIKAYGKVYYEFSGEEWDSKSEEEKEATIVDTADQATEEEGHTVYEDEVEVITENRKVTEAKDDLEGIKNLIVYEKTQDIFEELYHNKHLDCEYNGSNGVVKITSANEQTFNIIDKVMVDKLHYSKLSNYVYELNEGPIYRDIKGGFDFKGYSYKVDVKFSLNEKDTVVGTVGISKIDVKKENKNLTEDITSKDVDEIFSKYAETPVTVKNLKQKWASASDEMHGVIAGGWSAIITGNNFKIKVVNSLKLSGYKISGENIEEAEKAARKIYINATDIGYNTGLYESKEVKTEEDIEHFKEILAWELTEDRLKLMNVDEAHFSEGHKLSIYQSFIKRMNNIKYIDGLIQQYEAKEINTLNNTLVDLKRLKNMMLNKEESKKVEAKFKDKVKAIKKSLKKNDKRLSDETAEKSAEKIAGSMVKKEESKTADMDTVDIIMELEGGELTITDVEDWNTVKSVASDLQNSQGFYGRLLRDMLEAEEEFGGVENLPFPITM